MRIVFQFSSVALVSAIAWPLFAAQEPLRLPEFRVEGTTWRYGRVEEIEILTRAPESRTRAFVAALLRGRRLLPDFIRAGAHVPLHVILVQEKATAVPQLSQLQHEQADPRDWPGDYSHYRGDSIDDLVGEVHVVAVNLDRVDEVWAVLTGSARQQVAARGFPAWFQRGLFGPCGLMRQIIGDPRSTTVRIPRLTWPDTAYEPGTFPSEAADMPTFQDMFEPPQATAKKEAPDARFDFRAGLFARWSLFGPAKNGRNRNGYWAFAEMARRGQATEAVFRECYGMDWSQACAEMRAYLKPKNLGMLEVRMPQVMADVPKAERLEFRDATLEEVRRIAANVNRFHSEHTQSETVSASQNFSPGNSAGRKQQP